MSAGWKMAIILAVMYLAIAVMLRYDERKRG